MPAFKVDFATYSRIQKMNQKQLSNWLIQFGKTIYDDGYRQAVTDIKEKEDEYEKIIFNEEEFYNLLISIKGISNNIADKVMNAMFEYQNNKN